MEKKLEGQQDIVLLSLVNEGSEDGLFDECVELCVWSVVEGIESSGWDEVGKHIPTIYIVVVSISLSHSMPIIVKRCG